MGRVSAVFAPPPLDNTYRLTVTGNVGRDTYIVSSLCARDAVRKAFRMFKVMPDRITRVEVMGLPPVTWAPLDDTTWKTS